MVNANKDRGCETMRKAKQIRRCIKQIESGVLDEREVVDLLDMSTETVLVLKDWELLPARKVLNWVLESPPKKVKTDKNNKKLQEFGLDNPVKKNGTSNK